MYEEFFGHFGLQRKPFHVSPNPKAFYSTPVHEEALSQLVFGIGARQGLMVLTGEPGKQKYSSAYLFHTLVPSMDLLRLILRDFGVACDSQHKGDLLVALPSISAEFMAYCRAVGKSLTNDVEQFWAQCGLAPPSASEEGKCRITSARHHCTDFQVAAQAIWFFANP